MLYHCLAWMAVRTDLGKRCFYNCGEGMVRGISIAASIGWARMEFSQRGPNQAAVGRQVLISRPPSLQKINKIDKISALNMADFVMQGVSAVGALGDKMALVGTSSGTLWTSSNASATKSGQLALAAGSKLTSIAPLRDIACPETSLPRAVVVTCSSGDCLILDTPSLMKYFSL